MTALRIPTPDEYARMPWRARHQLMSRLVHADTRASVEALRTILDGLVADNVRLRAALARARRDTNTWRSRTRRAEARTAAVATRAAAERVAAGIPTDPADVTAERRAALIAEAAHHDPRRTR